MGAAEVAALHVALLFKSKTFRDSISPSAWPDIRIDLRELFA
jgi:hypothetical protein